MNIRLRFVILLLTFAASAIAETLVVGTLQSAADRAGEVKAAGVSLVTVAVMWDQFQPEADHLDYHYVNSVNDDIAAFRKAGLDVLIDLGMQYPPAWVKKLPHARYVNQHGQPYIDERPGADIVNGVFNQAVRDAQAAYAAAAFRELDLRGVVAVRLGWNYYGELGYPAAKFKDKPNCYWGFDDLAQGKAAGLAKTLKPCPVAGWMPGTASPNHASARAFVDWYLTALVDYQRWQIATVRPHFKGRLIVLLGSWGIRPGMVAKEVEKDLGTETQTELSLGYDFAALVAAIDDPLVSPCTTWIDADPKFGDDPPVAALAALVKAHPKKPKLWAENTGKAGREAMRLSFDRASVHGVSTLVWAFEPDLFHGRHASLADLKSLMDERRPAGHNSRP